MKTIMLLGFKKSNRALYEYLKNKRVKILIYEEKPSDNEHDYWSFKRLKKEIPLIDIAIRSPGIPIISQVYELIEVLAKIVMSEVDFAYLALKKYHPTYILVSGTNGKTTSLHMIKEAFNTFSSNVFLAGNVGIPLSNYLGKIKEKSYIILELSSFQLENTRYLKGEYAYLTNVYPNHLDAVRDYEGYVASKKRLAYLIKKHHLLIYKDEVPFFKEGQDIEELKKKLHIDLSKDEFNGLHNYRHALVALILVKLLGHDETLAKTALIKMKTLPYRMEERKTRGQLIIINDSKSTNVEATNQCLRTYSDKRRILIMGGHPKSESFDSLELRDDDLLYVYGEAKEEIASSWPNAFVYEDLSSIVFILKKYLNEKMYLLFSPGCSSFDQFKDFQERGAYFDQLLKENKYE